jgi:hypothetical protein
MQVDGGAAGWAAGGNDRVCDGTGRQDRDGRQDEVPAAAGTERKTTVSVMGLGRQDGVHAGAGARPAAPLDRVAF